MLAILSLLPLALLQVGPAPTTSPITAVPPELQNRPPRDGVRTAPMPDREANRPAIELCLDTARTDPAKARAFAQEWVSRTDGLQRATGRHCLGVAAGNLGDWSGASSAFLAARDEATDPRFRARMGALAGSALLAEARHAEALAALAEARGLTPEDPHAWLLSATLARRQGDLAGAQTFIERAAVLDPRDPGIGLEAGIIAALGGRDDAARLSFESVVAANGDGPHAALARTYLQQLAR